MTGTEEDTSGADQKPAKARSTGGTGRHSLLYLIGAAVQGLAAVLVQPFSIHLFGGVRSQGWETTAFSVAIMQVGLVILSAGLPLAITRAWLDPDDGRTKARAINGFNAFFALAATVLAILIAWAAQASPALIYAIFSMGALAIVLAAQAQLRAEGKALTFVALAAGSSLLAHLTGLGSILFLGASAEHFMSGFALASALTAVAGLIITRPTWPTAQISAVRQAVRAGIPLLPHSLAMILLSQGDAMILKRFAPEGDTGAYLAAAVFALGPIAVLAGLNNAWTPTIMKAAHQSEQALSSAVKSTAKTAVLLAGAMAILGSLTSPLIIAVIAQGNPETQRVATVLPLVAIGYALYLLAMGVLFARLATSSFAWLTVSITLLCAVLAFWPAQSGDLVGVALVKVAAFTLLGAGYVLMARRYAKLPVGLAAAALAVSGVVVALMLFITR